MLKFIYLHRKVCFISFLSYLCMVIIKQLEIMAVRNQHARTSTNHIFVTYNGKKYMLLSGAFCTKNVIYTAKKKLMDGKMQIPVMENPKNKSILIVCNGKGNYQFELI